MPAFTKIIGKDMTDFKKDINIGLLWFLWYFTTFLMNVVMLNFLIAVISSNYESTKLDSEKIYLRDQAQMNLECMEILSLFGRNKKFNVILFSYEKQDENLNQDMFTRLLDEVEQHVVIQNSQLSNLQSVITNQLQHIKTL